MTVNSIGLIKQSQVLNFKGEAKQAKVKIENKPDEVNISSKKIMPKMTGWQKMTNNFSQETIDWVNETRQMPKGFALQFVPKTNHYVNGLYAGTTPYHFKVIKFNAENISEAKKRRLKKQNIKITTKLPKNFELKKINGGTYAENAKTEDLSKHIKKENKNAVIMLAATLGIVGLLGVAALVTKKKPL